MNASVACKAEERTKLERLCCYVARLPLALERLGRDGDGLVVHRLSGVFAGPASEGSGELCSGCCSGLPQSDWWPDASQEMLPGHRGGARYDRQPLTRERNANRASVAGPLAERTPVRQGQVEQVETMKELRELTHSAHHLVVFEAAARNQSFTAAAHELSVTQPAVSRSIRQLEAALGISLFARSHRSVELTEAGEVLFQAVSAGFGRILETARRLRGRRQAHVTLLTSAAFANYWLVPRLSDFHARHPGIDLRFQVSDKLLGLPEESSSLGVRLGDGNWRGYDCEPIITEEVFPVASPAYGETLASADEPGAIAGERLIHLDEPFLPSLTWSDWFSGMHTDYHDDGTGLRLNHYLLVLQAAMAGEGIAMGWAHLVDPLIEQGLLVRIGRRQWRTERCFYLVRSNRTLLSPQAAAVRAWILAAAPGDSPSLRANMLD